MSSSLARTSVVWISQAQQPKVRSLGIEYAALLDSVKSREL